MSEYTATFDLNENIKVEFSYLPDDSTTVVVYEKGNVVMEIDSKKAERGYYSEFKKELRNKLHQVEALISELIDEGFSNDEIVAFILHPTE